MDIEVLGISGSPIESSNTDRLVNAILEATGAATEIPATRAARFRSAQASGRQIVKLITQGVTARKIISRPGLENAVCKGVASTLDSFAWEVEPPCPHSLHNAFCGTFT